MADTVAKYLEGELEACQRINAALVDALQSVVAGAIHCPNDVTDSSGWEYQRVRVVVLEKARAALALAEAQS